MSLAPIHSVAPVTHTARTRPPATPWALVRSFIQNRGLIAQMTRREVLGRYRGSVLGLVWSFFNPLLMLAVYTFAFSYVFRIRLTPLASPSSSASAAPESIFAFALYAFAGLILFNLLSETINRAPTLILSHTNYVKKVVFPLEILPWVTALSALVHALISTLILLLAHLLLNHQLHFTALFFPLILLPFLLLVMGGAWFLASLGVFLRDVAQTTSLLTMLLLYLAPVFYRLEPEVIANPTVRFLIHLNPLTIPIQGTRAVLLQGEWPDFAALALYAVASVLICYAGFYWFQRTKRGFADVL